MSGKYLHRTSDRYNFWQFISVKKGINKLKTAEDDSCNTLISTETLITRLHHYLIPSLLTSIFWNSTVSRAENENRQISGTSSRTPSLRPLLMALASLFTQWPSTTFTFWAHKGHCYVYGLPEKGSIRCACGINLWYTRVVR